MAGRASSPHHRKAVLLIETDVSFEVGIQITGDPISIGLLELGSNELTPDPLSLPMSVDAEG